MKVWLRYKLGSSILIYMYFIHVNTFLSYSIYWTYKVSCIRNWILISNRGGFGNDRQVLLDAIKKKTYDEELRREDLLMTIRRHHVHGVILFWQLMFITNLSFIVPKDWNFPGIAIYVCSHSDLSIFSCSWISKYLTRMNVDCMFMYSPLCRMEEMVPLIVDVGIRKMMETRICQPILVEFHVESVGIIMRGSRLTRLSFGQDGVRWGWSWPEAFHIHNRFYSPM